MKNFDSMDNFLATPAISYDDDADDRWRATGWAELPFFLAAARSGTLRAAAERMKVNHATVDRHIRALEEAYGVTLFERNPRGLTLTKEGEALQERAEQAELAVMQAKRAVSGLAEQPSGPVHLSLSSWHSRYDFPRIYGALREQFPEIDLRISVSDALEDLTRSPVDVSLRAGWQIDADVTARKIGSYWVGVLASKAYLKRHWDDSGPRGKGLHWIGKSTLWPNPELEELDLFPAATRSLDVRDPMLINTLIASGHGMAIMPLGMTDYHPDITVVPGTPVVRDRTLWVIYHTDLKNSARVRAVANFLYDMMMEPMKREDQKLKAWGVSTG